MELTEIIKVVTRFGHREETVESMTQDQFSKLRQQYLNDGWEVIKNPLPRMPLRLHNGTPYTFLGFSSPDFREARQQPWAYYWQLDQFWVPVSWTSQAA